MTNQSKIIRLPEVVEKVGLSKSRIYNFMNNGSFPQKINLGARSIGWLESEVNEWIASRAEKRDEVA